MGYTHYWTINGEFNVDKFKQAVADCKKVCDNTSVPICEMLDEPDKPSIFSEDAIKFNGVEKDGHENFMICQGSNYSDFCKTDNKPYDINVCCCLIVFNHYFGDNFEVRSDGDNDDWRDANDECKDVLGYGKNFKL